MEVTETSASIDRRGITPSFSGQQRKVEGYREGVEAWPPESLIFRTMGGWEEIRGLAPQIQGY